MVVWDYCSVLCLERMGEMKMSNVSLIDGHVDEPKCCENCVYYDTDRTDQPCCSCVGGCNFESESDTE